MGMFDDVARGAAAGSVGGPWGALIGAGVGLFGNLFGAHQQSKAASEAAQIEAAAQKYAADLQAKGQADALAFTKGQAENAYQNSEAARHGNYDQWAAAQRRIGSIGSLIGMGPREIPGYVAGVDPNFTGTGAPAGPSGAPAGAAPAVNANNGDIGQQISAFFKSRGVADSETPYWVQKWAEFGAKDPAYFNKRLAAADIFGGGGGGQATTPGRPIGTVGSYLQTPYAPVPITPGLAMPGAVGSYF